MQRLKKKFAFSLFIYLSFVILQKITWLKLKLQKKTEVTVCMFLFTRNFNFQGDGLGPIRYRSPHLPPLVTEEPEASHQPEVIQQPEVSQQPEVPKDVRDPVGLGAACAVPILTGIQFLLVHRWSKYSRENRMITSVRYPPKT